MKKIAFVFALSLLALALTACGSKTDAVGQSGSASSGTVPAARAEAAAQETIPNKYDVVDLDLSALSGTVVYSQVYDMLTRPETYADQVIRVGGNLSYYQNPESKEEYFAVLIADATACCAQGIEFVWAGEHSYPQGYPPLGTEVVVTGTFHTYEENGYMYLQLVDAQLEWAD